MMVRVLRKTTTTAMAVRAYRLPVANPLMICVGHSDHVTCSMCRLLAPEVQPSRLEPHPYLDSPPGNRSRTPLRPIWTIW